MKYIPSAYKLQVITFVEHCVRAYNIFENKIIFKQHLMMNNMAGPHHIQAQHNANISNTWLEHFK